MKVIEIDNPNDIIFPLEREIFEDQKIIYHGTWSTFSNMIESNGWIVNNIPYQMEEVKYVCDICEKTGLNGKEYYGVLKSYTLLLGRDTTKRIKYPSFSANYWISRNFASFQGGETVTYILEATQELLNCHRIEEPECLEMIKRIKRKYENLTQDGHGVVYVVEIELDWVLNWREFDKEPQIELILKNNVPFESIQVRIDYPNGLTPFRPDYDYPLPLSWTLEPFKREINKSKYKPQESILKEYLDEKKE